MADDEDKPSPGEGQLLVRTTRSLISTGTELTIFSGDFLDDSAWSAYGSYPFHAGYSNVGRVEAVVPGVRRGWAGKRVATNTFHAMCIVMNGVCRSGVEWGDSAATIRVVPRPTSVVDGHSEIHHVAEARGVPRLRMLWTERPEGDEQQADHAEQNDTTETRPPLGSRGIFSDMGRL